MEALVQKRISQLLHHSPSAKSSFRITADFTIDNDAPNHYAQKLAEQNRRLEAVFGPVSSQTRDAILNQRGHCVSHWTNDISTPPVTSIQHTPSNLPHRCSATSSLANTKETPRGTLRQTSAEAVLANLATRRAAAGRPEDIELLTSAQLAEEKRAMKRELRAFDEVFQEMHNRPPTNADKESLRAVYARYKLLKSHVTGAPKSTSTSLGPSLAQAAANSPAAPPLEPAHASNVASKPVRPAVVKQSTSLSHSSSSTVAPSSTAAGTVQGSHSLAWVSDTSPARTVGGSSFSAAQTTAAAPHDRVPLAVQHNASNISDNNMNRSAADCCLTIDVQSLNEASVLEIMAEKRALKRKLVAFQTDFENRYNKKVSDRGDRLPMESVYTRYSLLKRTLLAYVKERGPLPTNPRAPYQL